MKKWIIRIVVAVVILLVLTVVGVGLFLDKAVKKGVETVGPELTKTTITLDSMKLSIIGGAGSIEGLNVGNPEGYNQERTAIQLQKGSLGVSPGSLLSDKIVVKSLRIESADLYIAGTPNKNNLTKILENVEAATGGGKDATATTPSGKPAKKLQVDEFVLSGIKVTFAPSGFSGQTFVLKVPDIKLTNLGTGPDGITAGDLTKRVLSEVTAQIGPILAQELSKLGKQALETGTTNLNKAAEEAGKQLKGVTDMFKRKTN